LPTQLIHGLGSQEGGMVSFNCGAARRLGFDSRHEPENDNPAHAYLYCDAIAKPKERKRNAQRLAQLSAIVIQPNFS
jgi:hypothetical protein